MLLVFHVCHAIMSGSCSIVVTCWVRADLLGLSCLKFSCVFVISPYDVLGRGI